MHWLDPDDLPETAGTLTRFVLNGKAEIDGLILADGTEIHSPPNLSAPLAKALTIGSKLTVRGVKPRGAEVVVAVAIDPENHARILDEGPERAGGPAVVVQTRDEAVTRQGDIRRLLHGPEGNVHGALLEDGTIVRWPPHAARAFADRLSVGARLVARGSLLVTSIGTVMEAEAMGAHQDALKPLPKPPHKKPHDKHAQADKHDDRKPSKPGRHPDANDHGGRH